MKVIQINNIYGRLSTGKIVKDIHSNLRALNFESRVIYARGLKTIEPGVVKIGNDYYSRFHKVISYFTGYMYGGLNITTNNIIKYIEVERPDIVHLQCINDWSVNIYKLLDFLKTKRIPIVITLHAEFLHTGTCGHSYECNLWKYGCGKCPERGKQIRTLFDNTNRAWKLMRKSFDGFDNSLIRVVSVSPWLKNRACISPILSQYIHKVVLNGIDTNIFKNVDFLEIKKKLNIKNRKVVFHVTSSLSSDYKGGKFVIDIAKKMKKQGVVFVIAGINSTNQDLPSNMICLGRIEDQNTMASLYSMADLTLLVSKKETFSMVCAESLCCGTSVVGYKAGGPELISLSEFSEFIDYGNTKKLIETIQKWLKSDIKVDVEKAIRVYSRDRMVSDYMKVYQEIIKD